MDNGLPMSHNDGDAVSMKRICVVSGVETRGQGYNAYLQRMAILERQRELNTEINSIDQQILKLQTLKQQLNAELKTVAEELEELNRKRAAPVTTTDLHGLSHNNRSHPRYHDSMPAHDWFTMWQIGWATPQARPIR